MTKNNKPETSSARISRSEGKTLGNGGAPFVFGIADDFSLSLWCWLRKIGQAPKVVLVVGGVILVLGFVVRLCFLNQPIRYDEAYTFLYFASSDSPNGIWDYPLPNNHILHSILVLISTSLAGSAEWAIRLPALFAGICLIPVMFVLGLVTRGSYRMGLWASALVAASSFHVEYSVNGRGYTIVCLFTGLLFLAAIAVRSTRRSWGGWLVFVLASVAGLFTIPIMLYPLCLVTVWLLLGADSPSKNPRLKLLWPLVVSWIIIILGTIACYTPTILVCGAKSLYANDFVKPLPVSDWLARLPGLGKDIISLYHRDMPLWLAIILAAGFLMGCYRAPRLLTATLLTVPTMLFLQRVVPFPRVFTFGLVIYLLLAALGLEEAFERLLNKSGLKEKKREAVSSLLPAVWVVAAVFFIVHRGGPEISETGRFPEAPEVAKFLAENVGENELFFATAPAAEPIRYYGIRQDFDRFGFYLTGGHPPGSVKLVINSREETVQDLMNRYRHFPLFFKKPELMATIASAEIYNLESILLQQNKYIKIEHALNYWSKIKAKKNLDSRDIMVGEGLGYYLLQMKNYDKVMEISQDILQSQFDNEKALHFLGRIHHEKSQIDKASYYYQKVLDKNPKNVATLINMGMIAISEDKPEKAKQYYYRALSIDSTNLQAHFNLGNLFFFIGKTDQAEKHYQFVIKKNPENGLAHLYLGLLYSRDPRRHVEALTQLRTASRLLPEQADNIQEKFILPLEADRPAKSTDR